MFHGKNTILYLVLEVDNLVAPFLRSRAVQCIMATKDDPIDVTGEGTELMGPLNPEEAKSYREKVDAVFETFSNLLADDIKDALHRTVTSLKKVMTKHAPSMTEADVNSIMKTIRDPSCLHLHQYITTGGITVTEAESEAPSGWEFLRSLPEKERKKEERQLIINTFDHISEAMAHASMAAANISSLGKITDPETFDLVLWAAARPLVQINVPERYLSPMQDPKPASTAEEMLKKLETKLLPHPNCASITREPKNSPTRLLTATL